VEALFGNLQENDRLDSPLPNAVKIGHVHLHVRDLQEALDFYHGLLGFDHMGADFSIGMGFVSAGGYHHHIGLNTWQGVGAPAPPEGALGLRYFTINLPERNALKEVLSRVSAAGISTQESEDGFLIHDPSQNGILLRAAS
jgi:catechol 2,3-dioxygenase